MCRLTYSHCQKRESDLGCGGSSLNSNIPHPSQLRDIISSAFPGNAQGGESQLDMFKPLTTHILTVPRQTSEPLQQGPSDLLK